MSNRTDCICTLLDDSSKRIYNLFAVIFDEIKRQSNIVKHGIDFVDAEAAFVGVTITRTHSRDDCGEQRL